MSFLLDTNIISELRRPQPDQGVVAWLAEQQSSELYLSVLVLGELRAGIARIARKDAAKAAELEEWFGQIHDRFLEHLVIIDRPIAERWGTLGVPDPLPVIDGLHAATALERDWTLVTRNTRDVERTGVRLLNPFIAR